MEIAIATLIIYFIPTMIASYSKRKNTGAIFVLNFFLGWTFVGWVIALIWATSTDK